MKITKNDIYLGVDIGGTAVKLGLVRDGEIIAKGEYDADFDDYETPLLDTSLKAAELFISEHHDVHIKAIGISATGQIDIQKGIVAGVAGHIRNWLGSEIKKEFSDKFGVPVTVINDANAAALGEAMALINPQNIVVITIGTGVGGGIISDGRLIMGSRGIGGEIGHMIIDRKGSICSCGNNGCLEKLGSTTALVRSVSAEPELVKLLGGNVNGKTIFDNLSKSERLRELTDEWISCISDGITGLVHIFNPEIVIVGGGISKREEEFIAPLREKVMASVMPEFRRGLKLRSAVLGNDAGIIGAVKFCNDNI